MEPFKNLFNRELVELMATVLHRVQPGFQERAFVRETMRGIEALELKARSERICDSLEKFLPQEFPEAVAVLLRALHPLNDRPIGEMRSDETGLAGWAVMPMAEFIARRGLGNLDLSMGALREMTMRFSAEFAIRPLIAAHPKRALAIIRRWTADPNEHVRRLCSEGTRPRLPWGMRLDVFVQDPAPLLPILEKLKADPSEYVRRSVANNLNDIAKDHPDLVLEVARRWIGKTPGTDRLVKHACRTLLKRGDPRAMELFGFAAVRMKKGRLRLSAGEIPLGGELTFFFEGELEGLREGEPVRIEYAVHFLTGTGRKSRKVFKISERPAGPGGRVVFERKHSFQDRTIRRHHAGEHHLEVLINGHLAAEKGFLLVIPG